MEFFSNELMGSLLEQSLETAQLGPNGFEDIGAGPGRRQGRRSTGSRSPIPSRASSTTCAGSASIRSFRSRIPIYGYIYDVGTGRLEEVAQATEAGRAG